LLFHLFDLLDLSLFILRAIGFSAYISAFFILQILIMLLCSFRPSVFVFFRNRLFSVFFRQSFDIESIQSFTRYDFFFWQQVVKTSLLMKCVIRIPLDGIWRTVGKYEGSNMTGEEKFDEVDRLSTLWRILFSALSFLILTLSLLGDELNTLKGKQNKGEAKTKELEDKLALLSLSSEGYLNIRNRFFFSTFMRDVLDQRISVVYRKAIFNYFFDLIIKPIQSKDYDTI
jgi:hypothetical protein